MPKRHREAHALDVSGLRSPDVTFWFAWERDSSMSRLSLETGSWPYFAPARALYAHHGFVECPPFGDYRPDPNSVCMTLVLRSF